MKIPCSPFNRFLFAKTEPPVMGPDMKQRPGGSWYFLGDIAPYIVCPECGHAGRLGNHLVLADGTINPSIVCPMAQCGDEVERCTAHYYGKLDGWKVERPPYET